MEDRQKQSITEKAAALQNSRRPADAGQLDERKAQGKPLPKRPLESKPSERTIRNKQVLHRRSTIQGINLDVFGEELREGILWSEILGKPLSKRRKRRL